MPLFYKLIFYEFSKFDKSTSIPHKLHGHTNEFLFGNHKKSWHHGCSTYHVEMCNSHDLTIKHFAWPTTFDTLSIPFVGIFIFCVFYDDAQQEFYVICCSLISPLIYLYSMMGPLADQDARLNNLGFKLAQENKCVIILNLNSLKVSMCAWRATFIQ